MVPVPGIACKLLNARQASLIYNVKPLNKVRLQLRKKGLFPAKRYRYGSLESRSQIRYTAQQDTGSCPWGGRWGVHGPFVDSTGTGSVLFCSHGFGSGCQLREVSWLRIRIKDADTNLRGTKKQKPVTEVKIELNTKSKDFF